MTASGYNRAATASRRTARTSRAALSENEEEQETLRTVPESTVAARPRTRRQARTKAHACDSGVVFAVVVLLVIGLIALFSASYSVGYYRFDSATHFIGAQGMFAAVGLAAMLLISRINYHIYEKLHLPALFLALTLLVLVAIPGVGTYLNGARRWLFGFQPSEIMKVVLIICFAAWMSRNPAGLRHLKGLIFPYGTLLVAVAGLLFLEPHMSATLIMFMIAFVMLYVGGMKMWYFIPIIAAVPALIFAYLKINPYTMDRMRVWLDPFSELQGDGYQGAMSQIAIGSGGLFGLGLGQGRQKHLYLPEPQNDFIFSSWCEEMGLIGALVVIALFAYLVYRGFAVARASKDRFGCLLATGITAKLGIQTLMNLFVVSGIIPVTGASLPFFSYGGTALLIQMAEMGILLNVSRTMRVDARQRE